MKFEIDTQRRLMLLILLAATLVCIGGALSGCSKEPTLDKPASVTDSNTPLPADEPAPVTGSNSPLPADEPAPVTDSNTALPANALIDSMCVATHWGYLDTPYGSNYKGVKQKLVELGIRHIRDGGSSDDFIAKIKELGAVGIKTTFVLDPQTGVAPNPSYWVKAPSYYINDFVKNKVGTNAISAVEVLNEIDLFHDQNGGYYWRPGDREKLNNDPNSRFYWKTYAESVTKDTWRALKSDPVTADVKVIGPSLGRSYDYSSKSPLGDLSAYVDWGNFHPYPGGGNGYSEPSSYNTIAKYHWHGNFPSVNIDEWPYAFDVYQPPFGSKPMAATETGYNTSTASKGISEKMHGKYIPRLFLEYFRKGIVRTCSYELVDEWNQPGNPEANYGLLRHDLSPKPAYTALKNLIGLLKDSGASFTPGSLDYTLTVNPPAKYNRTQYVRDLLLQKRDGSFYLVLWHEISNGDTSSTPVRAIAPPPMPTKLTFATPISSATVYSLDDSGNMSSRAVKISKNTLNLNVTDKAMIVKLTKKGS